MMSSEYFAKPEQGREGDSKPNSLGMQDDNKWCQDYWIACCPYGNWKRYSHITGTKLAFP